MVTPLARLICLLFGHAPVRTGKTGYVDRIESVETHSGPGRVPVRTIAEVERCRRCPARHVVVDMAPLSSIDRRAQKWVTT